jgi:hypothetical protein
MSDAPPPRALPPKPPKRPRYLALALVGGWILGANAMSEGCSMLEYYKDGGDAEASAAQITDVEQRAKVIELATHRAAVLDAARNRELPINVGFLVLGAAMVMLSARAMSGHAGSRGALVQVTLARAGVVVAAYLLTPDVRAAELDELFAKRIAENRELVSGTYAVEAREGEKTLHQFKDFVPPIGLFLSSLASGLVVLGLTRPGARAFLESASGSFSER